MAAKPITKNLEPKTWQEFRDSGMFFFINQILHVLGWVMVVQTDSKTGEITKAFPARTKFRGFDEKSQDEEHTKIANYLADNAPNFPEEIK